MNQVKAWENGFHRFLDERHSEIIARVREEKVLSDEITPAVKAIEAYNEDFEARMGSQAASAAAQA